MWFAIVEKSDLFEEGHGEEHQVSLPKIGLLEAEAAIFPGGSGRSRLFTGHFPLQVRMRLLFSILLLATTTHAQWTNRTPAGEAPGPWLFGTVGIGKTAEGTPETTALKGLALKLGENSEAAICYDLDLCRAAGAWSGGKFTTPMNLMSRGEYPTGLGTPAFLTAEAAGIQDAQPWKDPRSEPFGPLPSVRYGGVYLHGKRAVIKWNAGATEILESPWYEKRGELEVFSRTLLIGPSAGVLRIAVCRVPENAEPTEGVAFFSVKKDARVIERAGFTKFVDNGKVVVATDHGLPSDAAWQRSGGQLFVVIPPHEKPITFRILVGVGPESLDTLPPLTSEPPLEDLAKLTQGAPARWPESVTAEGAVAAENDQPYVVETITVPDPNPWSTPMFIGGFDFFPDGRAAVCTFHGDVFIVSGLDAKLEKVTWRRFASRPLPRARAEDREGRNLRDGPRWALRGCRI